MSKDQALPKLKEGIAAAKARNKAIAYPLLKEAAELDPDNEMCWLWLAGVTETPQEALIYLERVLKINPFNKHALTGWKWAQDRIKETCHGPDEEKDEGWHCPLCLAAFPAQIDKCTECGAVLALSDLDVLLNNATVDRAKMLEVIDRYQPSVESDGDFDTHYDLVLAHLNLRQFSEATVHLRKAISIRPDDPVLQTTLEDLSLRLGDVATPAEEGREQGTVLVVDDSPTVRKLVEITLEKHGFHVIGASDGLEGLARISEVLPDVVLVDITMPRMDGYQLCKTLKGGAATKDIPVIMLSGKDGFFDKVKGRMVGSSDYITKPFRPDELVKFVADHLDQKRERRPVG